MDLRQGAPGSPAGHVNVVPLVHVAHQIDCGLITIFPVSPEHELREAMTQSRGPFWRCGVVSDQGFAVGHTCLQALEAGLAEAQTLRALLVGVCCVAENFQNGGDRHFLQSTFAGEARDGSKVLRTSLGRPSTGLRRGPLYGTSSGLGDRFGHF